MMSNEGTDNSNSEEEIQEESSIAHPPPNALQKLEEYPNAFKMQSLLNFQYPRSNLHAVRQLLCILHMPIVYRNR